MNQLLSISLKFIYSEKATKFLEELKKPERIVPCPSIGPKWFWTEQIVLDEYKLFWSGPSRYGRVQTILIRLNLEFYGLFLLI